MSKVFNIVFAYLLEHPLRFVLTTTATAAATCLVIWIASSYDALHRTYDEYANLALGRFELAIAPTSMKPEDSVPMEVVADLRADPAVAIADAMWAKRLTPATHGNETERSEVTTEKITDANRPSRLLFPEMLFVATDSPASPHEMRTGKWLHAERGAAEVVLRSDVAAARGKSVGDTVEIKLGGDIISLKVIGLANAPNLPGAGPFGIPILTPSSGEAYITLQLAERLFQAQPRVSLVGVSLREGVDVNQFRFGWGPKLNGYSKPVQFQESVAIEEALDQAAAAQNVRLQSYAATAIALLVAVLVVLCSLSVGVNERIRQYAILRAVGFHRRQIAAVICLEGFLLGVSGYLVGLVLSGCVLAVVGLLSAGILYHGIGLGWWSVTLSGLAIVGGSLIASIVPAYRATRVRPIDAMAPRPVETLETSNVGPALIAGVLLVLINPLLTFAFPPTSESWVYAFMAIGFVTMATGFVLLSPLVVRLVDHWFSPLLSRMLAVETKLVRSQISDRLWRSVGVSMSLAFGLGLYVGVHVWGWTMLEAFIPGNWAPDALAVVTPGLSSEQYAAVQSIEGIDAQHCVPMVVEQPRLSQDLTGSATHASIVRQDNVIMLGLNPSLAFSGSAPLLDLQWVGGQPTAAIEAMLAQRGCVVPDHFLRESGLVVGDIIDMVPPHDSTATVRYTIVGAVKLPGWHWQTKTTGLRPRTHRAAALIFASYENVANDFNLPLATHVWFNFDRAGAEPERIAADLKALTTKHVAGPSTDSRAGDSAEANMIATGDARVITVQSIREQLRNIARRWLWIVSQVPLLALVIASLGVLNIMLASVRARRWEYGVMRAIGIDQGQLTRSILVEGALLATVASILSILFGIMAGWCGCGLAQYISFFGGLHPPLVIPVLPILLGVSLAVLLGVLSACAPALMIGQSKPLTLLQQAADSL